MKPSIAEAWEMPAVWEQHCYDSVLAGKAVSAEDHRLAVNTAYLMGWETFRDFHDCYHRRPGWRSNRDSFRAQSGLDLIGAAWDAMLRHSAREALSPQDSHSPHRRAGLQGCAVLCPERHLRPLLHEPRQVQEHERLRGPGQVRAGRGQELCDELRAPDQRLGGVPGLRGDAQDGPQQGLHAQVGARALQLSKLMMEKAYCSSRR